MIRVELIRTQTIKMNELFSPAAFITGPLFVLLKTFKSCELSGQGIMVGFFSESISSNNI